MTHDELLKRLNDLPEVIGLGEFKARHDALLAVVELHKPITIEDYGSECEHCKFCGVCATCPTIQAIEKELS